MSLSRRCFTLSLLAAATACRSMASTPTAGPTEPGIKDLPADPEKVTPVTRTEEEWKKLLDSSTFYVLRQAGTERSFTGRYWDNHESGIYTCAGCGLNLFRSEDKFESGTGWPSFTRPIKNDRVSNLADNSLGMTRVEVRCTRCNGHLGHVFDDGPPPTGQRYCMNSAALLFRPKAA